MLQKAVDTTDLLGGGLLNTGQYDRFVEMSVDQSVMLKDARVVRMHSAVMELDKIATSGRVSQLRTEGVAPATLSEPGFSKVTLTAVDIITPFELTMQALEDSIERGDLENTVVRVMARQTATDLEELAIQGDTLSGDSFLQGLDGWRKLAENANKVNLEGATLDKSALSAMYKALPNRYKRNHGDLRYYFAPGAVQDWHDTFSDRASALGDEAMTSATAPPYMGVPLTAVPNIPTDQDGVDGYSGSNLSYGFLTPRENLVFGIHREIRIDKDRDILRGVNIYTITTRVAVAFEDVDAVVLAVNLGLSA